MGKAIKAGELPNDGGLSPNGEAIVRICANRIWPPSRHVVDENDVMSELREFLDAYVDMREVNWSQGSVAAHLRANVHNSVTRSRFFELMRRAIQDAHALGYALAQAKYAPAGGVGA